MDAYPLNLILAIATAFATIFLGFLPTKSINSAFFTRETAKASIAWALVAFTSPSKAVHYSILLAFLCFAAWWHFRKDRALSGKMWLSVSSGLGVSIGAMTLLATTPRALPPGLSHLNESLLLASIYLGGAVIGLAYVCLMLVQSTRSGAPQNLVQRYVGLLFGLVIVRAAVLLGSFFFSHQPGSEFPTPNLDFCYLLVGLVVLVLPALAFFAQRTTGFSSRVQPTRLLLALIFLGLLTEIGARLLML